MQLSRSPIKERRFPPVAFNLMLSLMLSNALLLSNSPFQTGQVEDGRTRQGGSSHYSASHWLMPEEAVGSFGPFLRQVTTIKTQKDNSKQL